MKSLSTIIEEADFNKLNQEQYAELIRKLNPELYLIHIALVETGVNSMIIPHIIRVIGNLAIGTGFGEITLIMRDGNLVQIRGYESVVINERATIDKSR